MRFELAATQLVTVEGSGRRIEGTVVPWDVVATVSGGQRVRFERGSIVAPNDVARSVLLIDHDQLQPIGAVASYTDTPTGLRAVWRVGHSGVADGALADAVDGVRSGLSIGVEPVGELPAPDADGVVTFTRTHPARWVETSLLSIPAYDDARVSLAVAASAHREGAATVAETETASTTADTAATLPAATTTAVAPAAVVVASGPPPPGSAAETPTAAAVAIGATPTITAVREPFPYTFAGVGPSMLRDYCAGPHDVDAADRLRRAGRMLADPTGLSVMAATPPTGTTDEPAIFPTLIRPDLWLAQIIKDSPLMNACTRVPLSGPNPFNYPVTTGSAGLVGTAVDDKTNPVSGTITTAVVTLQPTLIHGSFQFTRSLLDGSSPSIDVVAMAAIREALSEALETNVAAALAVPGDHTSKTGVVAVGDGAAYYINLRTQLAAWWGVRFQPPTAVLASSADYALAVLADDAVKRPLVPPSNPDNALGAAGQGAGSLGFYGLGLAPAWAAPAGITYLLRGSDVSVFLSPVQSFRFEEKNGPELIELDFRLYMVAKVNRKEGVWAIGHTLTMAAADAANAEADAPADDAPADDEPNGKRTRKS